MRVALFGATGNAGGAILRQCRAAGHEVHALVRDPGALGLSDAGVRITAGDVRDVTAVSRVIDGATAVISAIGGTTAANPAVLERGTAAILTVMPRHRVRRLIVIQGFHLQFPGDPGNLSHLGQPAMSVLLRLWQPRLHADTRRMSDLLRTCDVDWTLVRMPRLTAGPPDGRYRTGTLTLGPWSKVTTGQVGQFTVTCLADGRYTRAAPMIASAS